MIEPCLSFDSGRIVKPSGVFKPNGAIEIAATKERSILEFKDKLTLREFGVEAIFQDNVLSAVILYPTDANKGGYETPREKMEASVKEIERWLYKNISKFCIGEALIHAEFDPRSWCSYAVLELKVKT